MGAILDDDIFLGSPQATLQAMEFLRLEGPGSGLRLSPKTCVWSPVGASLPAFVGSFSLSSWILTTTGVFLLGSVVSLDSNFLNAIAMKRVQKWQEKALTLRRS